MSYAYNEHWATPDGLEIWHVSADVRPEGGEVVSHVGDIEIVLIDPDKTRDAFGVLDGKSGGLGVIGGAILDLATGGLDPELDERLEPFGNTLPSYASATSTPGSLTWTKAARRSVEVGATISSARWRAVPTGRCWVRWPWVLVSRPMCSACRARTMRVTPGPRIGLGFGLIARRPRSA